MIKILVVDDQPLLRAGFSTILKSEVDLQLVGEAPNGLEAIAQCKNHHPDIVLMDIRMPVMDGLEATRQILQLPDPPAVIILTTFDLDEYVFDALKAGASGFMLKDAPADDLINAIRVVASGQALLAPSVTKRMIDRFAELKSAPIPSTNRLDDLTEREAEVLQLMTKGMSNSEIANELNLGGTTIKTHVSRILSKLNARDRVQAVITAYEAGIVNPGR
jgi:DNA-binding NarL/FixJ family response regulator